jgi:ectoine hydroxylase-related dioxygenase (phytanoyl-CoA dioxygenase family)
MTSTAALVAAIQRDGYAVAPDLISAREVAEIKASLAPWLSGERMGRNDFEGFCTERVYALLAKAPPVARLVEHPAVLAVLDALLTPHYRLSACLAIQVHPGETPQAWHSDDGYVRCRARVMMGLQRDLGARRLTRHNGATEVIPARSAGDPTSAAPTTRAPSR